MAKYKDPDSWRYGGIKKRDFNQSHDGPEELPHKKKSKKKKRNCEHNYICTYETHYSTSSLVMKNYKCKNCGRKSWQIIYIDPKW